MLWNRSDIPDTEICLRCSIEQRRNISASGLASTGIRVSTAVTTLKSAQVATLDWQVSKSIHAQPPNALCILLEVTKIHGFSSALLCRCYTDFIAMPVVRVCMPVFVIQTSFFSGSWITGNKPYSIYSTIKWLSKKHIEKISAKSSMFFQILLNIASIILKI